MIEIKDIENQIKSKGLKKSFIIQKLSISKKTFYSRMKTRLFKPEEVSILKSLGLG
jgi:predicted DNA-binding transcriptional regulator AlpA